MLASALRDFGNGKLSLNASAEVSPISIPVKSRADGESLQNSSEHIEAQTTSPDHRTGDDIESLEAYQNAEKQRLREKERSLNQSNEVNDESQQLNHAIEENIHRE
eukprot:GHVH01006308.1.p1 GENE.GHVH01006308.1~~GHVH01006308.1.p1  ORF type:complete len:113 (-),score=20.30 GHVH01006308.1:413-730(-)